MSIVQIVSPVRPDGEIVVLGLGDDNSVYSLDRGTGKWLRWNDEKPFTFDPNAEE